MALNLNDKQAIVAEVSDVAAKAISLVAADYRGLTVSQVTSLRSEARNRGIYLRVVRNTLAKRAVADTTFSCVQDALVGPLVLAFSESEPGAAAKLLCDFAKENDALEIKFLSLDGKLLEASQAASVAKLPTREEALSQLLGVMKAPITKFAATVKEPTAKFVRTVDAVRQSKEAA